MDTKEAIKNLKAWNERHKHLTREEKMACVGYRRLRVALQKASHSTRSFRKKSSKSHKDAWMDPEKRPVMLAGNKKQAKAKSKKMLEAWSHEDFREKRLASRRKGAKKSSHQISSLEMKTIKLLVKMGYSETYKYNGLYGERVSKYVPDFLHVIEPKIIEVFGDYFHGDDQKERDDKRLREIREEGYRVLVIREHDFDDLKLLMKRIGKFTEE